MVAAADFWVPPWRMVPPGGELYGLFVLGSLVEKVAGRTQFFVIYLIATFTGSLASYVFNDSISVGASGAIFGLLGAALVGVLLDPDEWQVLSARHSAGLVTWALSSLLFGFLKPGIDNAAHIGGLIGGAAVAFCVTTQPTRLALSAICAAMLAWSAHLAAHAERITPYLAAYHRGLHAAGLHDVKVAESEFSRALPYPPALFARSMARVQQGNYDGGLADLDALMAELRTKPGRPPNPTSLSLRLFVGDTSKLITTAQLLRLGILSDLNRDHEAIAAADQILHTRYREVRARARFLRGVALARLGRWPEAVTDLEQGAQSSDRDIKVQALNGLAETRRLLNRQHRAASGLAEHSGDGAVLDEVPLMVGCRAEYPKLTSADYIEISFVVDEHGEVEEKSVKVVKAGPGGSTAVAASYIHSCEYRPGFADGEPVRAYWHERLISIPPASGITVR